MVAFVAGGGFATDLVTEEKTVTLLPRGMDFITASSFLVAYGTADYALRVSEMHDRNACYDGVCIFFFGDFFPLT